MPDDLRTALRRLNDAAHEALKAARAHPDPYGRGAVWLRLRAIADDTDRMVDETAPNVEVLPPPAVPSDVGEMMERCRRDVEELTGIAAQQQETKP